ncbi:hypothetical protein EON79_04060, partial [bacterium]
MLKALRGDFLCMPFGSNDTPYEEELHPPHGETANRAWTLDAETRDSIELSLVTKIRPGTVSKTVLTRPGEPVLYVRHRFRDYEGPMAMGHHAMLRFRSPGLLAVSLFPDGRVHPGDFEGKTSLPDGRVFGTLE